MTPQYIKTDAEGNKSYYSNKSLTVLHREDGPAIECSNGTKLWYRNGKKHRDDGPAMEYWYGDKYWFINDEWLSEAQFKARTSPHNGKTVIIDGIEYTLTVK
jgi:hypothetical protein